MKFILGLSVGISLGLLLYTLTRESPEPEHVCVTRPATTAFTNPYAVVEAGDRFEPDAGQPRREVAVSAPDASPEALSEARHQHLRSTLLRAVFLGEACSNIPSARRCLSDREYNPGGARIEDEESIRALERLIVEQNARLAKIGEQYVEMTESVMQAKLAAGIDPPSMWKSVPKSEILHKTTQMQIPDSGAPGFSTGTLIRRGETPELEVMLEELARARGEARNVVASWIASSGR